MKETCDRCGPAVRAGYRIDRVNTAGELYLCGPCASRYWRALSAQGWTFWPLGVHALAPQARAAVRGGPGSVSMRAYSAAVARLITAPCCPGRQLPPRPEPGTGAYISQSRCVSDRAFRLLCPGEREGGAR